MLYLIFLSTDAIANITNIIEDANDRGYEPKNIGTWSSISDVDTFFDRFNYSNAYKDGDTKLRIGNYITIQDGVYNTIWEIAGFNMEYEQSASDGTIYDNGYGVCMIPKTYVISNTWNDASTVVGGYASSTMHTSHLPNIINNIKNVLGNHIVTRNVLLSNSVNSSNGSYYSNNYTWTTAEATLMSVGQITGTFASNRNKYDDGEANYKLPLFDHKEFKTGYPFWTRGVWGISNGYPVAWYFKSTGELNSGIVQSSDLTIRPLIYLR